MSPPDSDRISPRDFGRLETEVQGLQRQVQSLDEKVDDLLALANRSRGALWVGMSLASLGGAILTFLVQRWVK